MFIDFFFFLNTMFEYRNRPTLVYGLYSGAARGLAPVFAIYHIKGFIIIYASNAADLTKYIYKCPRSM